VEPLAEDIALRMNGTDLIQILLNLAVNAFQCSAQPHRIRIFGKVFAEAVDLMGFRDSDQDRVLNLENFENEAPLLQLCISDTGPGIPAEILPKIFEPYFTTKNARQGTGLGLAIVNRLVRDAKGDLHVHTVPGEGTTFSVFLPAVRLHAV
jgi:signal transduction histidine kinase